MEPSKWNFKNLLVALTLPVIILVLWELSVYFNYLPNTLIANPLQVVVDFFEMFISGKLILHSAVSLSRLLSGFLMGTILGLALGIYVGVSKFGERLINPTFQLLAPIPPIAWIPLLIILFGIGEASKVALILIASFVVVYIHTVQGIRGTNQKLIDVAHVYKKSDKELVKKVLLPSAMPSILTGMRIALGLSWILLIAAEVIVSSNGLGWLIWDARNFSRPDDMFVGMIMIGILGKASDMLLVSLEKRLTRWRKTFRGK